MYFTILKKNKKYKKINEAFPALDVFSNKITYNIKHFPSNSKNSFSIKHFFANSIFHLVF